MRVITSWWAGEPISWGEGTREWGHKAGAGWQRGGILTYAVALCWSHVWKVKVGLYKKYLTIIVKCYNWLLRWQLLSKTGWWIIILSIADQIDTPFQCPQCIFLWLIKFLWKHKQNKCYLITSLEGQPPHPTLTKPRMETTIIRMYNKQKVYLE